MPIDYELRAARVRQLQLRGGSPLPKREAPAPKSQRPTRAELQQARERADWKLWWKICDAVSNCVPDGDPIDLLAPYVQRHFDCTGRLTVTTHINRACRKHSGYTSYNAYLRGMWDGYNEICAPEDRIDNPWR